jgi:hypothetical protein
VTGPNPDAELDAALGIPDLPPAVPTAEHQRLARVARYELRSARWAAEPGSDVEHRELEVLAQAIADAEQRGAARVIAEHAAARTPWPGTEAAG